MSEAVDVLMRGRRQLEQWWDSNPPAVSPDVVVLVKDLMSALEREHERVNDVRLVIDGRELAEAVIRSRRI